MDKYQEYQLHYSLDKDLSSEHVTGQNITFRLNFFNPGKFLIFFVS